MKFKYNGCPTHHAALSHVIGQLEQVNEYATVSDIAAFMCRTKTTATKYLKQMERNGEIIMTKKHWRGHAEIIHVNMTPDTRDKYLNGAYRNEYLHIQAVVINNA